MKKMVLTIHFYEKHKKKKWTMEKNGNTRGRVEVFKPSNLIAFKSNQYSITYKKIKIKTKLEIKGKLILLM